MIKVIRTSPPDTLDLENRNSLGAIELKDAIEHFSKGSGKFDFKVYKRKEVKEALKKMFYDKCAYCEASIEPVTYGDIEHFRPKSAYQQDSLEPLVYPGYYWLAMDWNNLLLACDKCNRTYKKNFFPIVSESKRNKSHSDDLNEDPLLLNPCDEDFEPSNHICFRESGEVYSPEGEGSKGYVSIETYGLYNKILTEKRRELAVEIADRKTQISTNMKTIAFILRSPRNTDSKEVIEANIKDLELNYNKLIRATSSAAPYSGMARQLTNTFFEEYKIGIEKFLTITKELIK